MNVKEIRHGYRELITPKNKIFGGKIVKVDIVLNMFDVFFVNNPRGSKFTYAISFC